MTKLNHYLARRWWLALLALGVLALTLAPRLIPGSQAQSDPLLIPTERAGTVRSDQDETIIRRRNVLVDLRQLYNRQQERVLVPLFDSEVVLTRERQEETGKNGFLWQGKVAREPGSLALFSIVGEVVTGNISTQKGELYQIGYLGRGVHELRQIDERKFPVEEPPDEGKREPRDKEADTCATDPPSDIDVMVVYTATTRAAAGGADAMQAEIYQAVATTNLTYANSNITQRLRLVHTAEVSYTETGNVTTDRDRLRGTSDGFMDNVHTLRNTYAADVVILFVENIGACGKAFIMESVGNAFEDRAFAVVKRSCASTNFSFPHELAHIMSARHDWFVDSTNNSPYVFNHGFTEKTPTAPATPWRTVMAYVDDCGSCPRVPYFSNPNVNFPVGGDPMGVASGSQQANNRQTLNNTALTVANFRCSSPSRNNVWMKDTWSDTGAEPDPATAGQHMWQSPYIWIRNTQDAGLLNQHQHQNPEFGATNWVYAKLHNGAATTQSGNLELYYANASTGLSWPADWTLLTTVPVSGFAAHSTRVVEAQWSSLPGVGHYCMLARWVSAADPMTHPETASINANVRNNNNLVWRNLNIVDLVAGDELDAVLIVRNSGRATAYHSLLVRAPIEEANHSFIRDGQVIVNLDSSLLRAWRRGGLRGTGFKVTEEGLLITDPDGALFEGLVLSGRQVGRAKLTFKKLPTTPKRQYTIDAIQFDPRQQQPDDKRTALPAIGGVSYQIHTDEGGVPQ